MKKTIPCCYSEEELYQIVKERLQSLENGTDQLVDGGEVFASIRKRYGFDTCVPCAYTREQMEKALREAEEDYQSGHIISHNSICERYGI